MTYAYRFTNIANLVLNKKNDVKIPLMNDDFIILLLSFL